MLKINSLFLLDQISQVLSQVLHFFHDELGGKKWRHVVLKALFVPNSTRDIKWREQH